MTFEDWVAVVTGQEASLAEDWVAVNTRQRQVLIDVPIHEPAETRSRPVEAQAGNAPESSQTQSIDLDIGPYADLAIFGVQVWDAAERVQPRSVDQGMVASGMEWDIDSEEYRQTLSLTCADNLKGKRCRPASCIWAYHVCLDFKAGICRKGPKHDNLVHVKQNCFSIAKQVPCNRGPHCELGHDNMDIRRNALERRMWIAEQNQRRQEETHRHAVARKERQYRAQGYEAWLAAHWRPL